MRQKIKTGNILLLFTTIFFSLIFFINYFRSVNDSNFIDFIYYTVLNLGYSFIYGLVIYIVYIFFAIFSKTDKIPSLIYITIAIVIQIVLIIDSFVFSIYKYHLNLSLIEWFFSAGSDVFVFDIKLKILLFVVLLLFAFLPYFLIFKFRRFLNRKLSKLHFKLIFILLFICFGLSNSIYILARKSNHNSTIINSECIPWFQSSILNRIVKKWNFAELDDIDHTMYYVPQKDMNYPLKPIVSNDSISPMNIVMILIDSWSIRTFNENVTPSIFQFSEQADRFNEHYSGANATIGGVFSLFYSLPYSYQYSAEKDKVYPVLFEEMKKKNYNIGVFSSANLVLETTVFGGLEGINHSTSGNSAFERDIKITDNTLAFLQQQSSNKPFFTLAFYDLAHAISIPKEYRNQFTPSWDEPNYMALNNDMDPVPFFNLYQNCVYFIDSQIKRILDELENRQLLDNTVVIITGDHGQEFNESKRNNWGHFSNYSRWQIQTPFIIYNPKRKGKSSVHKYTTTHYDVAPTLLHDFLGVANPYDEYSLGANLYDSIGSRYPFWSGDFTIRTSLVFEDVLTTVEHGPAIINITDRDLNPLTRSVIEDRKKDFIKAQEQKERFYK